jgi:aspartate/methionine/tyrosine aminotransferase
MKNSVRLQRVQAPIIPIVGELIRENPGTISLGQGVVYYAPPQDIYARIHDFSQDDNNHKYKLVQGIPELLELIQRKLETENNIPIDGSNSLIVTAGGNMAFMNAVLAITDPGDEIIVLTPYYFNHEMAITLAACKAVCVSTDEDYQPRIEALKKAITERTRAIVIISPNNPTGAVYSQDTLSQINTLCRDNGIYHISDEAYEYFTYDGHEHFSPGSIPGSAGHTISLFSLSKAYGFASWRIGYMVVPEQLLMGIKKIQDTILICPPVISQWAALGALQAGSTYCREKLKKIIQVRNIVIKELHRIHSIITIPPAFGAFYFLLRVHTDLPSMTVVERLIKGYNVAVIPGTAFGIENTCCVRIAYGALKESTAREGIGRFVEGLKHIV